jgi:hypothetical protein
VALGLINEEQLRRLAFLWLDAVLTCQDLAEVLTHYSHLCEGRARSEAGRRQGCYSPL